MPTRTLVFPRETANLVEQFILDLSKMTGVPKSSLIIHDALNSMQGEFIDPLMRTISGSCTIIDPLITPGGILLKMGEIFRTYDFYVVASPEYFHNYLMHIGENKWVPFDSEKLSSKDFFDLFQHSRKDHLVDTDNGLNDFLIIPGAWRVRGSEIVGTGKVFSKKP